MKLILKKLKDSNFKTNLKVKETKDIKNQNFFESLPSDSEGLYL